MSYKFIIDTNILDEESVDQWVSGGIISAKAEIDTSIEWR